jgi:hypothetical protein
MSFCVIETINARDRSLQRLNYDRFISFAGLARWTVGLSSIPSHPFICHSKVCDDRHRVKTIMINIMGSPPFLLMRYASPATAMNHGISGEMHVHSLAAFLRTDAFTLIQAQLRAILLKLLSDAMNMAAIRIVCCLCCPAQVFKFVISPI